MEHTLSRLEKENIQFSSAGTTKVRYPKHDSPFLEQSWLFFVEAVLGKIEAVQTGGQEPFKFFSDMKNYTRHPVCSVWSVTQLVLWQATCVSFPIWLFWKVLSHFLAILLFHLQSSIIWIKHFKYGKNVQKFFPILVLVVAGN
jgi:hypothetical protein